MRTVVGISQKIKRAWLDSVLDRLVKTTDKAELRTFLDKRLKEELPGTESRAKSAGILLRIWSNIPPERVALRERAVALLPRISGQERIWLHWGMTALAYPFFRDIAEVVGRLLALQDDFTTAQVQGRMLTTWGDRATSKEATQKLITTLVDWEVLRSTKTKGRFLLARKMKASIPDLQLWLLEALLGASAADEIEAQQLLRLPESFPFTLSIGIADLRRHDGFNIHRQGLDMDMVDLRKVKLEPVRKPTKKPKKEKAGKANQRSLFDMRAKEFVSNNGKHETVPLVPLTEVDIPESGASGLHAKPGIARRQMPAERAMAPVPASGAVSPGEGGGKALHRSGPKATPPSTGTVERPKPMRFQGTVELDPTRVVRDARKIADEVISHLVGLVGSSVTVTLEIEAEIKAGTPDSVVRTVTENCRTLKFSNQGFESE